MPAPPAELAILSADEVKVGSCLQDAEPQTPVTPVSAESFMSLQNLIIQEAHALDETSKQSLARHLQKCTKAYKKSSAQEVILEDRVKFLTTINNEAKVRRSTKSLVLGKAKVMSYEDLEEARAKRANKEVTEKAKGKGKRGRKRKSATPDADETTADKAKRGRKRKSATQEVDEATADKAKRGRKRKSAVLEAEAPDPIIKVARMSNLPTPGTARASVVQMSGAPVAEDEIVLEPWRAPVARMY
jgi:hypothetical protein